MTILKAIATISLLASVILLDPINSVQAFSLGEGMLSSKIMKGAYKKPYLVSSSSQVQCRSPLRTLMMADSPQSLSSDGMTEDTEDPLQTVTKNFESMNMNGIINTSILFLVTGLVLSRLATVDMGITRGWTAAEMALRIPVDNWLSYSNVLENSPISTKAVTSATVYTIGDLIAQRTEGSSMENLDRPRIIRSLVAGLIGHGPMSHVWYNVSEYGFDEILRLTAWWSFIPKVIVDQALWGPFWNNTYILLLGLMKMDKLETIWSEMKRTTVPLIVAGLKLWPLAHCVTYGLIPVENRLLWVDLVEIIWVVILASTASGGAGHGGENVPEPESIAAVDQTKKEELASQTMS